MRLVIDTNILISALIRDSITRQIILKSGWRFLYPKISLNEIEKYKTYIMGKAGLSNQEFDELFNIIISYVSLLEESNYQNKLDEAEIIMKHIDEKDVVFIASALASANDGIWTDDGDFDKQNHVKIWKTGQVVNLFRKAIPYY
ncbi:hypothetical protein J4423_01140 [Candidatus Pacearchaeota archaeon]|nr:hypothetical protein [Candidatus Pacearchaeota archaeon]